MCTIQSKDGWYMCTTYGSDKTFSMLKQTCVETGQGVVKFKRPTISN